MELASSMQYFPYEACREGEARWENMTTKAWQLKHGMFIFWKRPYYFYPVFQFSAYLLKAWTSLNQFALVSERFHFSGIFFTRITPFLADNAGYDLRKPEGGIIQKINKGMIIIRMTKTEFQFILPCFSEIGWR